MKLFTCNIWFTSLQSLAGLHCMHDLCRGCSLSFNMDQIIWMSIFCVYATWFLCITLREPSHSLCSVLASKSESWTTGCQFSPYHEDNFSSSFSLYQSWKGKGSCNLHWSKTKNVAKIEADWKHLLVPCNKILIWLVMESIKQEPSRTS